MSKSLFCWVIIVLLLSAPQLFAATPPAAGKDKPQPASTEKSQNTTLTAVEAFVMMLNNAERGNAAAMLNMGTFYEQGIGTPRNFIKAREWYQKAAEAGLPEGYFNLGVCYEIGLGTSGDMALAIKNYQKAADMKQPQALYKLASLYASGEGVSKNEAKAVEYLIKAADAGVNVAANELGVIYLQGGMKQKKDGKKALEMFMKAADMGNLEAIKNIAVIFKDGIEHKASPAAALKWYIIAQKGGYQSPDMDEVIKGLKASLKPDQIKTAEADANKWIEAFRKKAGVAATPPAAAK